MAEAMLYQNPLSNFSSGFSWENAIYGSVPSFLLFLYVGIAYISTELAITNKKVIAKFGLVRRKTFELELSRIDSFQVEQSIPGRIFGYGDVLAKTAGGDVLIPGVNNPLHFRKEITRIQETVLGKAPE